MPDENGIIKVTAYAGSDTPDEDGFGREEYYDWWYLDENLQKIPGSRGISGYSNHDRRMNEDKFNKQYNDAVKYVKERKAIKARITALFEEFEKGNV